MEVSMPGPFFWFFAVIGLVALVAALRFALRPTERGLSIVRRLAAATLFSALASFFMGFANGLVALRSWLARDPNVSSAATFVPNILGGVTESFIPLALGSAILAVVWLLVAVGLRRQP
jgi:hypothetical protein